MKVKDVRLRPYCLFFFTEQLLSEVIVENSKVINALRWAVGEMERRYRQLQDTGSRDITSYNEKVISEKVREMTDSETGEVYEQELEKLPLGSVTKKSSQRNN